MPLTEPLSPLDATFLELEEADVTAHMHIGGVLVFDPLPGGGTPTLARLRRHLERRLDKLPRYRQRLSRPARPAACTGRRGSQTRSSTSPPT